MKQALLHAVVRLADAQVSDADLLGRFVRTRDETAFEELVHRHGPLVWSVCRQVLPNPADAEDAFQAVFLALIQGSAGIRSGQALPAWLHGVAIRAAEKVKRSAVRRRQREGRAATPESDRPVPESTWAAWMHAVHEEVQRLPDLERAAFIICELEGVRQPDAAVRLGWPLGTVSGRLSKARQRLIDRLSRRGVLPGMLAIGGLAGTAAVVPATLVNKVLSLPSALADGVSSTVASLAHGLAGGVTMRMKLIAATLLVAGAVGLTGGTIVLSNADGQTFGQNQGSSTGGGATASVTTSSSSSTGQDPGTAAAQPPGTSDPSGPGAPGLPAGGRQPNVGPFMQSNGGGGRGNGGQPNNRPGTGAQSGGRGGQGGLGAGAFEVNLGPPVVAYKFVDLPTSDRDSFVEAIKKAGSEGWEFCGSERLSLNGVAPDGVSVKTTLVLVFKKHTSMEVQRMGGVAPLGGGFNPNQVGGPGGFGMAGGGNFAGGNIGQGMPGNTGPSAGAGGMPAEGKGNPTGRVAQGKGAANSGPAGAAAPSPAAVQSTTSEASAAAQSLLELKVIALKHANANDLSVVLTNVFSPRGAPRTWTNQENFQVSAVDRTNQLIIRATPETLKEIDKLLKELDVPVKDITTDDTPAGPSPRRKK